MKRKDIGKILDVIIITIYIILIWLESVVSNKFISKLDLIMIPKRIHQIFWPFSTTKGKELNEIDIFRESTEETKRYCDQYNYEYKMWNLKDCEELLCEDYPQYIWLWTEFRYDIQLRCISHTKFRIII